MWKDRRMDKPDHEMIDELQFTCPNCGGHEFGTEWSGNGDISDMSTWEGLCHGYIEAPAEGSRVISYTPCGFKWDRKTDAQYLHPTGKKHPKYSVGQPA